MTMAAPPAARRSFLRSAAAAALTVVTVGTQAVFGAAVARAAYSSCCFLLAPITAWCPLICNEQSHQVRCWSCNQNRCKCCECSSDINCFLGISVCAYMIGCCEERTW